MMYGDRYDDCCLQVQFEKKILCFVWLKQTPRHCRDETTGSISRNCPFHWNSWAIVFLWIGDTSYKCQSERGTHTQLWLHIQRCCQSSIVSLCHESTVVENKQQQSSEWAVKRLLPLEQPLHSEAKMGQSHTCPAKVAPLVARPPSPRTVCALRLAEPSPRFCCHYQHFSYPERPMSYSPPYSPSLFKRPDRR